MASRNLELLRRYPVAAFYILAFTISWLGWIPQAAYSHGLFPIQSPFFIVDPFVKTQKRAVLRCDFLSWNREYEPS